jgi:hypothetical protein
MVRHREEPGLTRHARSPGDASRLPSTAGLLACASAVDADRRTRASGRRFIAGTPGDDGSDRAPSCNGHQFIAGIEGDAPQQHPSFRRLWSKDWIADEVAATAWQSKPFGVRMRGR